jgi:hypothetical protein
MKARIASVGALLVVALVAAGCVREPLPEGWRIDTHLGDGTTASSTTSQSGSVGIAGDVDVPLDGATQADVHLTMGAGELRLAGGETSSVVSGSFDYKPASWKPEVDYAVRDGVGYLQVKQPTVHTGFNLGQNRNEWDLKLIKDVPMNLVVEMGAGTSALDLSGVVVRNLTMRLGAGESTVDLTGPRTEDLNGEIQAGVGQLSIVLPKDVGVKVTGRTGGIGTFEAEGFKVQGDSYVNDAYGTTPATIELKVMRGVGEVKLELQ